MQINPRKFSVRLVTAIFAGLALSGYSPESPAWGSEGHIVIGMLAIDQLQPAARLELEHITGPLDERTIKEACNWPDSIRETEKWAWASPRHYINIPRGEAVYLESRDCPDQLCNTEAIKESAANLANRQTGKEQRWQAFAWLCHLVGDLHQPLHAGFADDRGGNDFEVVYKDERMNLHTFWDHELIDLYAGSARELVQLLRESPVILTTSNWSVESVNDWTAESHKLAEQKIYPVSMKIDDVYSQQGWELVQRQIRTAASRLALIINSELQDSD